MGYYKSLVFHKVCDPKLLAHRRKQAGSLSLDAPFR